MPVVSSHEGLEKLTRRHAVKVLPQAGCSVEEVGYAVGEVVGFDSVKTASRMNSAVVIFLDEVHKVEQVVEAGIVLRDMFTPVFPLVNPSKKITISNAPPFIKNNELCKALSRYGQIVSPIKMVLLGCKSPKLKHVVCHRRQVFMIPRDADSHLNLTLNFKTDGFNYVVIVTTETMKCFGCGAEEHLIRACPEARKENAGASGSGQPDAGASGAEQPAENAGASVSGQPDAGASGSGSVNERLMEKTKLDGGETSNVVSSNNENMVDDVPMEDVFNERWLSLNASKRKNSADKGQGGGQSRKTGLLSLSDEEEEAELTLSQEERVSSYSVVKIKRFLTETKGQRAVKPEQFFPDLNGFIRSLNRLRKEEVFSDQEVNRLKKLVTKAKAALIEDDD